MKENKENKVKRWERLKANETYWYIDEYNGVIATVELNANGDDWRYQNGNYYYSKEEAEYFADKQQLINDIRRWKRIHDNTGTDWKNTETSRYQPKVGIGYLHGKKQLKPMEYMYAEMLFSTFFTGVEIAEACIETFRDEIVSVIERGKSWE